MFLKIAASRSTDDRVKKLEVPTHEERVTPVVTTTHAWTNHDAIFKDVADSDHEGLCCEHVFRQLREGSRTLQSSHGF